MTFSREEQILVVDDAPDTLEVLQRNLQAEGYRVFTAPDVDVALRTLQQNEFDLVITDYKMPRITGFDLVRHVHENFKNTEVMMITGFASIGGAVGAVKAGAADYLAKPFTDEELITAVRGVLERLRLRRSAHQVANIVPPVPGMIGDSAAMKKVFAAIAKAAPTSATVLITGESGTGKELVARAIHYGSPRAIAPFIPVNCSAIPESLLESELFGFTKGSFTGAHATRPGFFQTADGGTIFLDEISATTLSTQVKLLRVLQEREISMIGSHQARKIDIRVLAATNKDLLRQVEKELFREDLYFRLNVILIALPPLRDRADDIFQLVRYFARRFADELGKAEPEFSEKALQVLRNYHWPGNVRELENVVQRLVVMTEASVIEVADLPSLMRFSALRSTGFDRSLADVEVEYVRGVLASVDGNRTRAAQILGIDRKTLREKLRSQEPETA
ncbi:MAG: sigma-54 dependent transcriptional regulator [Terriglobales bacterium]|jgi:two-component system, NtrC family, response regulator HydG